MLVEEAIKLHQSSPPDAYKKGLDARFLRINEKYGFKIFPNEWDRDKSHRLQSQAAEAGLAPQALDKFNIDGISFGFVTEAVTETLNEKSKTRFMLHNECMRGCPEYAKLINDMYNIGMFPEDMWGKNVGYMPDGRLVCIDFGAFIE